MRLTRVAAGVGLLAALVALSSDGLRSQEKEKKAPEPNRKAAKGQLPLGWGKLDLTDAQKAEVFKLNAEYGAKVEKLREEIRVLQAELARKRVAVLTQEQKNKLIDVVTSDPPKENPADKGKGGPAEKEKPKAKDPDK
jgi:Spy/CpxP family protein refolding chaperone